MREINEDLECMHAEKSKSKPKPRPKKSATIRSGPPQTSNRLAGISTSMNPVGDGGGIRDGDKEGEESGGKKVGDGGTAVNSSEGIDAGDDTDVMDKNTVADGAIVQSNNNVLEEVEAEEMAVDDTHPLGSSSLSGSADRNNDEPSTKPTTNIPTSPSLSLENPDVKETLPATAQEWFVAPYKAFTSESLGDDFRQFLQMYALLEESKQFHCPHKGLAPKGRPQLLSKWVAQGRMQGPMPVLAIDNIDDYENEWWTWWTSLQPSWRERDTARKFEQGMYRSDWAELNFGGMNGWLGVVATLFWWGMVVKQSSCEHQVRWQEALKDSRWMLQGLIC